MHDYGINYEQFCIAVGVLSGVCSFSVVLTVLLFPSMMRRKIFMHTLIMMSLCDCLGSFAFALGFPVGGLCTFQAAMMNFFYRGTWMWTTMLSYQLYCLVLYGKPYFSILAMHSWCWSVNTLLELLPLTTNYYGEDDAAEGLATCYIANGSNQLAAHAWEISTFTFPLVVCIALMSYFSVRMILRYRKINLQQFPLIKSAIQMTGLYPIGLVLLWLPHVCLALPFNAGVLKVPDNDTVGPSLFFTFVWGALYGIMLSLIFFIKGSEARKRWFHLLMCASDSPSSVPSDFEDYSDSSLNSPLASSHYLDNSGHDSRIWDQESSSLSSVFAHPARNIAFRVESECLLDSTDRSVDTFS